MQIKALTVLMVSLAALTKAQYFDMPSLRSLDIHGENGLSLSEKLEAAEREGHPMLQGSDRIQDARMSILDDFNHVIPFKFGNSATKYHLVPDTSLSEVAVITDECKHCTGTATKAWRAPPDSNNKNVTGVIEDVTYFYRLHAFDTKIKGTFITVPTCIEHDPLPSICLLNFEVFAINATKPFLSPNGDGYMGLGLGDSLGDKNEYSILSQMKKHGLIDKKVFSVFTQMQDQTELPSQIRFGAANDNLFEGTELHWINTLNENSWKVKMSQVDFGVQDILRKESVALMNPSFPFIAAPFDDYKLF